MCARAHRCSGHALRGTRSPHKACKDFCAQAERRAASPRAGFPVAGPNGSGAVFSWQATRAAGPRGRTHFDDDAHWHAHHLPTPLGDLTPLFFARDPSHFAAAVVADQAQDGAGVGAGRSAGLARGAAVLAARSSARAPFCGRTRARHAIPGFWRTWPAGAAVAARPALTDASAAPPYLFCARGPGATCSTSFLAAPGGGHRAAHGAAAPPTAAAAAAAVRGRAALHQLPAPRLLLPLRE